MKHYDKGGKNIHKDSDRYYPIQEGTKKNSRFIAFSALKARVKRTLESMSEYALVALISYGYSELFKTNLAQTIFLPNIVFAWRFFVSCRDTLDLNDWKL